MSESCGPSCCRFACFSHQCLGSLLPPTVSIPSEDALRLSKMQSACHTIIDMAQSVRAASHTHLCDPTFAQPRALALATNLLARPVDCRPLTAVSMKSCASLPTHQLVVEAQAGLQVPVQAQQRRQPQQPQLARPPLGLAHGTTVCLRTCLRACGGSHAYALCVCPAPSRPLTPSTLCVSPGVPLRTQQAPRVVPSARLRNRRHGWSAEPKQLSDQNPLFSDVVRAICSAAAIAPQPLHTACCWC